MRRRDLLWMGIPAGLPAAAAEDWTRWSDKKVLQVLTDSPWAHRRKARLEWFRRDPEPPRAEEMPGATGPNMRRPGGGNPIGGIGVPRTSLPLEADLIIRWSSALPVRQARALYIHRSQAGAGRALAELLGDEPEHATLEIHGLPAQMAHKGAGLVELAAMQGVRLRLSGGRMAAPVRTRADVTGLTLDLYAYFDRAALQQPGGEIEVIADVQVARFRERFRTAQMMYGGRLAI